MDSTNNISDSENDENANHPLSGNSNNNGQSNLKEHIELYNKELILYI